MVLKQNKKDFVDKDSHSPNISMQCLLENAPLISISNHAFNFFLMLDMLAMGAFNPERHQNIFHTTLEEFLYK